MTKNFCLFFAMLFMYTSPLSSQEAPWQSKRSPLNRHNPAAKSFSSRFRLSHTAAGGVDTAWIREYGSGRAPSNEHAQAATVDRTGNVYVTGFGSGPGSSADYLTIRYASTGDTVWTRRYNGPANNHDEAVAIAVDSSGNVYVTGYSIGLGGSSDFATIKYNPAGDTVWIKRFNGPGHSYSGATSLAIDGSGNVHVAGVVFGTETAFDFATIKYTPSGDMVWMRRYNGPGNGWDVPASLSVDAAGNVYVTGNSWGSGSASDYATVKYDSAGNTIWVNRFNGPGNSWDEPVSLSLDSDGSLCVTGSSEGTVTSTDYATVKYNSIGDTVWVRYYNGYGNSRDEATALAIDANGNVFVTGSSDGSGTMADYTTIKYNRDGVSLGIMRYNGPAANGRDEPTSLSLDGDGNVFVTGSSDGPGTSRDFATVKYNSSGEEVWVNRYNGPGNGGDGAAVIAAGATGVAYVVGTSFGAGTLYDFTTIKYDSAGDAKWAARYDGLGSSNDRASAFAVDAGGNAYVTGASYDSESLLDYTTIKYNSSGMLAWARRYNGPGNSDDKATALAVDGSGNVYVTGIGDDSGMASEYATLKYNPAGEMVWVRYYNGPGNNDDIACSIAADGSGNVYVTGSSDGSGTSADYATIKYNSAGDSMWVRRYNGPGNSWDEATSLSVDGNGNIYVTGESKGSGTYSDFATIKYNSDGGVMWVGRYDGAGNDEDGASALAVDGSGNVYVTGSSYGLGTYMDYATIKYNSVGDTVWVKRYGGPDESWDEATSLAVDAGGNVYVTGSSGSDIVTLRLSSGGHQEWVTTFDHGAEVSRPCGIGLDAAGYVYVAGASGGNNWSVYATMKYAQSPTSVKKTDEIIPTFFSLEQNFPNPFNPSTSIQITLPAFKTKEGQVGNPKSHILKLSVFDLLGREVATLVDEVKPAGRYTVTWDASRFPSGVYIYQLKTNKRTIARKMLLVK